MDWGEAAVATFQATSKEVSLTGWIYRDNSVMTAWFLLENKAHELPITDQDVTTQETSDCSSSGNAEGSCAEGRIRLVTRRGPPCYGNPRRLSWNVRSYESVWLGLAN